MSTQSSSLSDLLFHIRQHPAFPELLRAVEKPRLPRFKKSMKTIEEMGAQTLFVSGQLAQDDTWRTILTGDSPSGEDQASQQE